MRTRGMIPVLPCVANARGESTLCGVRRQKPGLAGWSQQAIPYNRVHALDPARENLAGRAQVRARRVPARPRTLPLAAPDGACAHVLARPLRAARSAPEARAGSAGADLRQVRPGALDAARS